MMNHIRSVHCCMRNESWTGKYNVVDFRMSKQILMAGCFSIWNEKYILKHQLILIWQYWRRLREKWDVKSNQITHCVTYQNIVCNRYLIDIVFAPSSLSDTREKFVLCVARFRFLVARFRCLPNANVIKIKSNFCWWIFTRHTDFSSHYSEAAALSVVWAHTNFAHDLFCFSSGFGFLTDFLFEYFFSNNDGVAEDETKRSTEREEPSAMRCENVDGDKVNLWHV